MCTNFRAENEIASWNYWCLHVTLRIAIGLYRSQMPNLHRLPKGRSITAESTFSMIFSGRIRLFTFRSRDLYDLAALLAGGEEEIHRFKRRVGWDDHLLSSHNPLRTLMSTWTGPGQKTASKFRDGAPIRQVERWPDWPTARWKGTSRRPKWVIRWSICKSSRPSHEISRPHHVQFLSPLRRYIQLLKFLSQLSRDVWKHLCSVRESGHAFSSAPLVQVQIRIYSLREKFGLS